MREVGPVEHGRKAGVSRVSLLLHFRTGTGVSDPGYIHH